MKNITLLKTLGLGALASFAIVQACNRLDLQPLDRVTTSTFYKTQADFDGAVFAGYSAIQDFWGTSTETLSERGEFWAITLATTDDVEVNTKADNQGDLRRARDLDQLLIRASDVPFAALYTQVYKGVLRANLVIENAAGENSLTAAQKTQYVAEGKFLRAFFHFVALQMWGTPPLVLAVQKDISTLATPNATKEQLYAAILKDLHDAYAGLPATWDAGNTGRATKWTARAFEGKVNVWKKDWPAAIAAFDDVNKNNAYKLWPNYDDAFAFNRENGQESIFEVQYGGPFSDDNLWVFDDTHSEAFKASQGTGRVWYWDASSAAGAPGGHMGWYAPTKSLVDEFEKGDPRLSATLYQKGDMYYTINGGAVVAVPFDPAWSSTGYSVKKYGGKNNVVAGAYAPHGQANFNNERWYRYAEMQLLNAEALIEAGRTADGLAIINGQIRARVGLSPTTISDPRKALRHEKRVEMAFEPHRWFDITRWGIGREVFGAKWDDKFNVFPLPQSEIDRSGGVLKQNSGY